MGMAVPEVRADTATGLLITCADMPLLERVRAGLRGDQDDAYPLPAGYLSSAGDSGQMQRRAGWRFEPPPPQFLTALARLRRLVNICPGTEVSQHSEAPWRWTATLPGICEDAAPLIVTGEDLTGLADQVQAAVERRTAARAALERLRAAWGGCCTVWYADDQWWYRRRDGTGDTVSAPAPEALGKLISEDTMLCPVRQR
jgi:hypothetical protein